MNEWMNEWMKCLFFSLVRYYCNEKQLGDTLNRWNVHLSNIKIQSWFWLDLIRYFDVLESGQMDAILLKTIWNLDKMSGFRMVWFSNGGDNNFSLRYSPTLKRLNHLKSNPQKVRILNGRISDPHCSLVFKRSKSVGSLNGTWFRSWACISN